MYVLISIKIFLLSQIVIKRCINYIIYLKYNILQYIGINKT